MAKVRDIAPPPSFPTWASLGMGRPFVDMGGGVQGVLDALALTTTTVPVVGDVAGLAADGYRFATDPESRTWGNAAWASLGMLPFVPAMGAMTAMGSRSSRDIADSIARWAEEMGLSVERLRSKLSGSQYLSVSHADPDGNVLGQRKIRVSDHDLPPSYGQMHGEADYEIGPHAMGAEGGSTDAVMWMADQFGLPVPKGMSGAVARRQNELAEVAARRQREVDDAARAAQGVASGVDAISRSVPNDPGLADRISQAMAIRKNDRRNVAVDRIAQELGVERQSVKDWFYKQNR